MKTSGMIVLTALFFLAVPAYGEEIIKDEITFSPIEHASFVIHSAPVTIYVDPVGEPARYEQFLKPDLILITHTHQDHLAPALLEKVKDENTAVLGPKAVIDSLGYGTVIKNGESTVVGSVLIEAVPMYNISEGRVQFHEKGVGNGYVVTINQKRIYISGDTEDIPELRELKNIDYAFLCMNLPYTMAIEQAASLVLAMKPHVVFPYHYRSPQTVSDVEKFKGLVSKDSEIEVQMLKWY